ncbi:SEC-C domain-containing protein [Proteiniclasticum sp. SCR006]|uniref:SEC-C domain-containing protein n=1 Tax=Proteiniclasticum aestuarii TaxID=2817862 RepID=A0A939H7G5_9CLOT|nr:SEC-C metal-binding domain-containing protein [Proteiniclasticum aestuarii]MBO1265614.1 SEC-C domain-containing protein [Proteiniclasticum aestuarii]
MNLYKSWNDMVVDYVKTKGEKAFWEEYSKVEGGIYRKILDNPYEKFTYRISDLAKEMKTTDEFVMGFTDGVNDSLNTQLDLENIGADDEITLDINLEKLYYNMLDAKADYLYEIPAWENILTEEKREEIQKELKDSRTVRNENKIGRNDPCPCGSGKKYKKCCGKVS